MADCLVLRGNGVPSVTRRRCGPRNGVTSVRYGSSRSTMGNTSYGVGVFGATDRGSAEDGRNPESRGARRTVAVVRFESPLSVIDLP